MISIFQKGADGPVALCFGNDPAARTKRLQGTSSTPIRVVGCLPGGGPAMARIKRDLLQFARSDRGWLYPGPKVVEHIVAQGRPVRDSGRPPLRRA